MSAAGDNPYRSPTTPGERIAKPPTRATRCPACGKAAVSLFGKSRIEPFRNRDCRVCGVRVGVAWRWSLISIAAGLSVPGLLLLAVYALADADGNFLPESVWRRYGTVSLVVIFLLTAGLGGGLQVATQTLLAPLVEKPAKRRGGKNVSG